MINVVEYGFNYIKLVDDSYVIGDEIEVLDTWGNIMYSIGADGNMQMVDYNYEFNYVVGSGEFYYPTQIFDQSMPGGPTGIIDQSVTMNVMKNGSDASVTTVFDRDWYLMRYMVTQQDANIIVGLNVAKRNAYTPTQTFSVERRLLQDGQPDLVTDMGSVNLMNALIHNISDYVGYVSTYYYFNIAGETKVFNNMGLEYRDPNLDTRLAVYNINVGNLSGNVYSVGYDKTAGVIGVRVQVGPNPPIDYFTDNLEIDTDVYGGFSITALGEGNKIGSTYYEYNLLKQGQLVGYTVSGDGTSIDMNIDVYDSSIVKVRVVSNYYNYFATQEYNVALGSNLLTLNGLTRDLEYRARVEYLDAYGNVISVGDNRFYTVVPTIVKELDVIVNETSYNSITFQITKNFEDLVVTRNGFIVNLNNTGGNLYVDDLLLPNTTYDYVFADSAGEVSVPISVTTLEEPLVKSLVVELYEVTNSSVTFIVTKNFDDLKVVPDASSVIDMGNGTFEVSFHDLSASTEYNFVFGDLAGELVDQTLTIVTLDDPIVWDLTIKLVELTDISVKFNVKLTEINEFVVERNGTPITLSNLGNDVYEDADLVEGTEYVYVFKNNQFGISKEIVIETEIVEVIEGYWTEYVKTNLNKNVSLERLNPIVSALEIYVSNVTNVRVQDFRPDLRLCVLILTEDYLANERGLDQMSMGDVSLTFSKETNKLFNQLIGSYRSKFTIRSYKGSGRR